MTFWYVIEIHFETVYPYYLIAGCTIDNERPSTCGLHNVQTPVVHGHHITLLMRMVASCCQGNDTAHAFRLQDGEQVNTYLYYSISSFRFALLNSYIIDINFGQNADI